jgi:peptide/nickel transport system substrate-binding protein
LRPDGKRLVINIENSSRHPDFIPTIELVVEYWRALGIEVTAQTIATTLQGQRGRANELMMTIEALHTNIWKTANGFHHDYLPRGGTWAPLWYAWYNSNGAAGEEPPPDVKRLFELSEELGTAIPESPEALAALDEIYQRLYDNVYYFVTLEKILKTQLVSARLGNVPTDGHSVGVNYSVEQMFFRSEG